MPSASGLETILDSLFKSSFCLPVLCVVSAFFRRPPTAIHTLNPPDQLAGTVNTRESLESQRRLKCKAKNAPPFFHFWCACLARDRPHQPTVLTTRLQRFDLTLSRHGMGSEGNYSASGTKMCVTAAGSWPSSRCAHSRWPQAPMKAQSPAPAWPTTRTWPSTTRSSPIPRGTMSPAA